MDERVGAPDGFGRNRNTPAPDDRRHRRIGLAPAAFGSGLVLHSRGDARVPFEQGRQLAQAIPNARLVPLESKNHLILSHEPAFARFLDEMLSFLDEPDEDAPTDRSVGVRV
jgi:pimeloyl-ACP methyl ester carboxylesterase